VVIILGLTLAKLEMTIINVENVVYWLNQRADLPLSIVLQVVTILGQSFKNEKTT